MDLGQNLACAFPNYKCTTRLNNYSKFSLIGYVLYLYWKQIRFGKRQLKVGAYGRVPHCHRKVSTRQIACSTAHKVNFYPLVDFFHLCYLLIIKFFIPLSSFSLFNYHRSAEFLCKSLRFLYHAFWPFRHHIDSTVCLTCAVANLVKLAGLGSRKPNVRLCGERL